MENNFNLTKQIIKAALKKAEEKAAKEGREIIVIRPERNFAKEILETLDLDLSKRDDLPIFYGETIGAAVKKHLEISLFQALQHLPMYIFHIAETLKATTSPSKSLNT